MFGQKLWFFVILVVYLESCNVHAIFSTEERATVVKSVQRFVKDCRKEQNNTFDLPKPLNDIAMHEYTYCFTRCIFKKVEILDKRGMFDAKKALEFVKSITDNEKTLAKAEEVIKQCSAVNEEEVSDGSEGCDRTKLLLTCYREHRQKDSPSTGRFWNA